MTHDLNYLRDEWLHTGMPLSHFYPLLAAYGGSERHYHGVGHIHWLLGAANRYAWKVALARPVLTDAEHRRIRLAIFYHDLVYIAGSPDNERASASLAHFAISTELGDLGLAEAVQSDILRTRDHFSWVDGEDIETSILLDVDLAGLGAPWETYQRHTRQIRLEFSTVDDAAFRIGRIAFLERALATTVLYRTPIAISLWEARAHQNMGRELSELNGGEHAGD